MENELDTLGVAALHAACEQIGLPAHHWHRVPHLARERELVAWLRVVARLGSEGMTQERAADVAAARLGLEPETMRSRHRRMVNQAFGASSTKWLAATGV